MTMHKSMVVVIRTYLVLASILLIGCGANQHSADVFNKTENISEKRNMQMRAYMTNNKPEILASCISVLQDMGYNIDETNSKLGLVSGSKLRDTDNKGEKAALVALSLLAGRSHSEYLQNADDKQNIRVSLVVTKPEPKKVVVRATFQRVVWNVAGNVKRLETINDQTLYQGFFAKLSKAAFLEANEL